MVGGGRNKEDDMKLILGTANFGQEYRGVLVPRSEQKKIWSLCRARCIDTVDTSTAYGQMIIPYDFKVIRKIVKGDRLQLGYYKTLIHHREDYGLFSHFNYGIDGVSIYKPEDLLGLDLNMMNLIQLPINKGDMKLNGDRWVNSWSNWLKELKQHEIEIHARSIFGGREFISQFGLNGCMQYVKSIPEVDGIVVGVENCDQLEEIIEVYNAL